MVDSESKKAFIAYLLIGPMVLLTLFSLGGLLRLWLGGVDIFATTADYSVYVQRAQLAGFVVTGPAAAAAIWSGITLYKFSRKFPDATP